MCYDRGRWGGVVWYGMVWYGMVWYGMVWYGTVRYGMVWYGMVWYGMVWYGMVWYGMVWYGMVWYGMVWYGMVWYGMVWYGMVWYGMVWYGMVCSRNVATNPHIIIIAPIWQLNIMLTGIVVVGNVRGQGCFSAYQSGQRVFGVHRVVEHPTPSWTNITFSLQKLAANRKYHCT